MEDHYSAARLADRARIQDALYRYCRAIDRRQFDELALAFHADATIDNGHFKGGLDAFACDAALRHAGIPQASHMIANILIEFVDSDRAFVESYGLALEHHPARGDSAAADRIVRVRYADLFERRLGLWRIARRSVVVDNELVIPLAACAPPLAQPERFRGTRDERDPAATVRQEISKSSLR